MTSDDGLDMSPVRERRHRKNGVWIAPSATDFSCLCEHCLGLARGEARLSILAAVRARASRASPAKPGQRRRGEAIWSTGTGRSCAGHRCFGPLLEGTSGSPPRRPPLTSRTRTRASSSHGRRGLHVGG